MKSKNKLHGELIIDHRGSPGLSAEFYRQMGVDLPGVGEGQVLETKTLTCFHCNTVMIFNPLRTRERGYCPKCDGYLCDGCMAATRLPNYVHTPFEKVIDVIQEMGVRGITPPDSIVQDGIKGQLPSPTLILPGGEDE